MKFIEILNQLNIEYAPEGHHHCRAGWIQIDCPFCAKDSHKWHMGYSIEDSFLNCWRCGSHGLIDTLMEITDLPYSTCKKLLVDLEKSKVITKKHKGKLIIPKRGLPWK